MRPLSIQVTQRRATLLHTRCFCSRSVPRRDLEEGRPARDFFFLVARRRERRSTKKAAADDARPSPPPFLCSFSPSLTFLSSLPPPPGSAPTPQNNYPRYELGRQPANTKLSSAVTVRRVRVRGGNFKFRALRLDHGNFAWGSEAVARKTRILDVVYNASNNELVRTQTLVKSAVVQVDAAPFKQWYAKHYGVEVGTKRKSAAAAAKDEAAEAAKAAEPAAKKSNHVARKLKARGQARALDQALEDQFSTGRLYASIASRPGQCGRADGYILEGKELEFYVKKMQRKKSKA